MELGRALLAFSAVFVLDIVWVFYTRAIVQRKRLNASLWAVAIGLCTGTVTLSLVLSGWYLIPASLGAFCGTFIAVGLKDAPSVD